MLSQDSMCWICGKAVDLKTCKTDEHGSAVHEHCYAAKIALAKGAHSPTQPMIKPTL